LHSDRKDATLVSADKDFKASTRTSHNVDCHSNGRRENGDITAELIADIMTSHGLFYQHRYVIKLDELTE